MHDIVLFTQAFVRVLLYILPLYLDILLSY